MLHVMFCYNLDIKQMLLYDEVIKLTCIYKGLILANNAYTCKGLNVFNAFMCSSMCDIQC